MSISSNMIIEVVKDYGLLALIGGLIIGYVVNALSGGRYTGRVIGVLAVIVFLAIPIFRPLECEKCGATMQYGHSFCSKCGNEQENGNLLGKIKCEYCDSKIDADANVCGYCGKPVDSNSKEVKEDTEVE